MEKWQENLEKAREHFKTADHMSYVSISVLGDYRLLGKILDKMYTSLIFLMKALLQYEYSKKNIYLFRNSELNFKVFKEKIAPKYLDKADLENVLKIISLKSDHNTSESEFIRGNKFVIFLGDRYEVVTVESTKVLLSSLRKLFSNVQNLN